MHYNSDRRLLRRFVIMENSPNVRILDHPLISHKVAALRRADTPCWEFRETVSGIASLMAYEAFRDVPTEKVEVRTPLETCTQTVVKEDSVAVVPILRAGLGMLDGVLRAYPQARIGHIGLRRDEETHEPEGYYCRLPAGIEDMAVFVVDPMLATGGSASAALRMLKERGCRDIRMLNIIAAPEGVDRIVKEHPDVRIYIAALDRCLNRNAYILPGLGDAGDRIFGTL